MLAKQEEQEKEFDEADERTRELERQIAEIDAKRDRLLEEAK